MQASSLPLVRELPCSLSTPFHQFFDRFDVVSMLVLIAAGNQGIRCQACGTAIRAGQDGPRHEASPQPDAEWTSIRRPQIHPAPWRMRIHTQLSVSPPLVFHTTPSTAHPQARVSYDCFRCLGTLVFVWMAKAREV